MQAYALLDDAEQAERSPPSASAPTTLVSFLTPIAKACLTEWSIENTYNALQCFGGHGYIHEHGMEQLRARRPHHHAVRRHHRHPGAGPDRPQDRVHAGRRAEAVHRRDAKRSRSSTKATPRWPSSSRRCAPKCGEWGKLTIETLTRAAANPEELGAASTDYLFYSGYVVLAYWWARSVAAANASDRPQAFKDAKRDTARFYFARILPRTLAHKAAIEAGAGTLMAMPDEGFGAH